MMLAISLLIDGLRRLRQVTHLCLREKAHRFVERIH